MLRIALVHPGTACLAPVRGESQTRGQIRTIDSMALHRMFSSGVWCRGWRAALRYLPLRQTLRLL